MVNLEDKAVAVGALAVVVPVVDRAVEDNNHTPDKVNLQKVRVSSLTTFGT